MTRMTKRQENKFALVQIHFHRTSPPWVLLISECSCTWDAVSLHSNTDTNPITNTNKTRLQCQPTHSRLYYSCSRLVTIYGRSLQLLPTTSSTSTMFTCPLPSLTLSTPTFLKAFWRTLKLAMYSCSNLVLNFTFFIIKQPTQRQTTTTTTLMSNIYDMYVILL